jgi:hypothetical protein
VGWQGIGNVACLFRRWEKFGGDSVSVFLTSIWCYLQAVPINCGRRLFEDFGDRSMLYRGQLTTR